MIVLRKRRGLQTLSYGNTLPHLKSEIHQLSLKLRSNPSPHFLQMVRAKAYWSLLKFKARQFKQLLQVKLLCIRQVPQGMVVSLRDLKSNAKWEDPDQHVPLEDFTSFFHNSYMDGSLKTDAQNNPDLTFECSDYFKTSSPQEQVLDDPMELPITPSEISLVLKKLSMGKATGLDNISNEMLKIAGTSCMAFFAGLFNKIYFTSCFPTMWKQAYITTLHKKGSKQDPANYRLGKVFTGALIERLMSFMPRKNIAHPFQGAFTRGRRGTDHIFLANTLIDQAKFLGHPLYAAFIDLQKAYDRIEPISLTGAPVGRIRKIPLTVGGVINCLRRRLAQCTTYNTRGISM